MPFLVSVGICVRNGETTLSDAVESILSQDFPTEQLQIIFVDDGSQDATPKIIQRYLSLLGERAKSFRSQWRGLGHARNIVVRGAEGEYVLFVDADEILTSNYVKTQVDILQNNPDLGITAGMFKLVPGNLILNLEVAPYIVNQKNYSQSKQRILKNDRLIGTGGTTFRTKALRQVGGFDESIKGSGEDTDLILRILKAGWKIKPNNAELYELHGGLSKPHHLWKKYFWYGYGSQKSYRQTKSAYSLPGMTPMAGFIMGLLYSFPAYRFMHKKAVFLLPLHFTLKLTAWTFGFMKSQLHRNS